MRNIILTRVDDRLIHGEVITGWLPACKINRIYIVDDAVASDTFARRVLQASAPKYLHCFVYPVEEAAQKLQVQGNPKERLLILVKTPLTLERLRQKGVSFKEINLGGVGPDTGRRPFFKNISLNPEEVLACDALIRSGCKVYYQLVPDQRKYEVVEAVRQARESMGI